MDPLTWITLISAIIGGVGAYQQGVAVRTKSRFQARVAKANQKTAEMEADYAKQIANKKSGEQRMKARRLAASQRAAQASSGFVVGEGSFGDILEDTALLGEQDALTIRHEGALAAHRAKEQAKMYGAQGRLYSSQQDLSAIGAGATLLTGLKDVDFGKLF